MKSAIYTVNAGPQVLVAGQQIDLGNVVRRFGCNTMLNGDAIIISGQGYYHTDANITINGTAGGTATITLLKDGVAVPGAVATALLANGSVLTLGLHALLREACPCADSASALTLRLDGVGATITNVAFIVEKV